MGLYQAGLDALRELLVGSSPVAAAEERTIALRGADPTERLIHFLADVLYLYDTQLLLCCACTFATLEPTHLTATVTGEPLDPERHPIDTEIKAVTYHQLAIAQVAGRWQARVIFDL